MEFKTRTIFDHGGTIVIQAWNNASGRSITQASNETTKQFVERIKIETGERPSFVSSDISLPQKEITFKEICDTLIGLNENILYDGEQKHYPDKSIELMLDSMHLSNATSTLALLMNKEWIKNNIRIE